MRKKKPLPPQEEGCGGQDEWVLQDRGDSGLRAWSRLAVVVRAVCGPLRWLTVVVVTEQCGGARAARVVGRELRVVGSSPTVVIF